MSSPERKTHYVAVVKECHIVEFEAEKGDISAALDAAYQAMRTSDTYADHDVAALREAGSDEYLYEMD